MKEKKRKQRAERTHKECTRCHTLKPLSEFHADSKRIDGHIGLCKPCKNQTALDYYATHRDTSKRARGRFITVEESQRREKEAIESKQAKQQARQRKYLTKEEGSSLLGKRAKNARLGMSTRFKKKGVPFERKYFTLRRIFNLLKEHPTCECCGTLLELQAKLRTAPNYLAIDKIVPARGYVEGNVAALCMKCNRLKNNATHEELRQIADWLESRT